MVKYSGFTKIIYFAYLSSRYIVERPIFNCLATDVGERPDSINFSADLSFSLSKVGRPGILPFSRAAVIPSLVLSAINLLSKCAIAPNTWNTNSPAAEEVSIFSGSLRVCVGSQKKV